MTTVRTLDDAGILDHARDHVRLGQPGQAEELCRAILRRDAHQPEALHLLGMLLLGRGRADLAIPLLRRAIAVRPEDARFQTDLGHALRSQGEAHEALACYERAHALAPDPGLRVNMALLLPVIPQSAADIRFWRERLERELDALADEGLTLDDPLEQVGMTAFHLAYHGVSDRRLQEKIARLYLDSCPGLAWTAPHCRLRTPRPSSDGRYRIGIVTAYLRYHTIAKVNRGLIRFLDRERFEVTVFHLGPEDAWTAEIAAGADRAIRLPRSLAGMREAIAAEELDLLFNIDAGMHAATTFLAYARLAPVQCVSWGHPVTTGIPAQDWYISAADLEPDGSEAEYTERLVRFDRLPTCYLRPEAPSNPRRERFGFEATQRLYVCPQLLFKLHPSFDDILAGILRRDPVGVIVLLEGAGGTESPRQRLVRERFARAHPALADRLIFRPFLDAGAFIELLAVADVLLDPPWFGGGNTSLEAFAVGTPIVTWPGPFARGRTTFAGLKRMGVLDGVVDTLEDYADRAVHIATDPALREDIRRRIRARNHLVYEDPGVIGEFETFFARAIDAARRGAHA